MLLYMDKRAFADVIKDLDYLGGPNCCHKGPYNREAEEGHTEGEEKEYNQGGREWSDVATGQVHQ